MLSDFTCTWPQSRGTGLETGGQPQGSLEMGPAGHP